MDVQCPSCHTEYDFDDALLSARGTTVRCTSCNHQFRVHSTSAQGEDLWIVRSKDSKERSFTALRELQKAISAKLVLREDDLIRGDNPGRPLSSIPELARFFESKVRESASPTPSTDDVVTERRSLPLQGAAIGASADETARSAKITED